MSSFYLYHEELQTLVSAEDPQLLRDMLAKSISFHMKNVLVKLFSIALKKPAYLNECAAPMTCCLQALLI